MSSCNSWPYFGTCGKFCKMLMPGPQLWHLASSPASSDSVEFLCLFDSAKIFWMVRDSADCPRKHWMVLGKHISPRCLTGLLGLGNGRLSTTSHGKVDHRFACFGLVSRLRFRSLLTDIEIGSNKKQWDPRERRRAMSSTAWSTSFSWKCITMQPGCCRRSRLV